MSDQISEMNALQDSAFGSTPETVAKEPVAAPVAPKDPNGKVFAALSRKERALNQERSKFQKERDEWERSRAIPAKAPEIPFEKRFARNPLEAAREKGLGYDKLTEIALNNGELPMSMQLKLLKEELEEKSNAELQSIRAQLEERDKKAAELEEQQTLQSFKRSIESQINSSDKFKHIKALNIYDKVYDHIQNHYDQHGEVLEVAAAAEALEKQTESELRSIFEKLGYMSQKPDDEQAQQFKPDVIPAMSYERTAAPTESRSVPRTREDRMREAAKLLIRDS